MSSGDVTLGYLKRLSLGPHGLLAGQEKDDVDVTGGTISGVTIENSTIVGGNFNISSLEVNQGLLFPKLRAAASAMRNGTADILIGVLGDSTVLGYSPATSTAANTVLASFPGQLMEMFRAANIPANINSMFGNDDYANSQFRTTFDDRYTPTLTWATGFSSTITLGGNLLTGTTGAAIFTPREPVDSFDVYTPQNTTLGSMTIDIDGGSTTTVNQNGTITTIKTNKAAATLGIHSCNIITTSGGVGLIGIVGKNSLQKQVYFFNWGVSNARADQLAATNGGYGTLDALKVVAPNLLIVDVGINDWLQAHGVPSFTTALNSIITAGLLSGDVLLVTPAPTAIATVSLANQQLYVNATIAAGAAFGVPVLDMHTLLVSQEFSNALTPSLYGNSTVHPSAAGYTNEAQAIFDLLAPYFAPSAQAVYKLPVQDPAIASTAVSAAPLLLTTAQSGATFTNQGATAKNYYTLPLAANGLEFSFIVQDADGIRVVANTGDTIRIAGSVSGSAGLIESTTIGDAVTLRAINATEWIASSVVDAAGWTVT